MEGDIGTCSAPPPPPQHPSSSSPYIFYLTFIFALPTIIWLITYIIPQIYMSLIRRVPDLKTRYNATWALVTGGGSGIGKALCFKLASQGLNVVVVSLDDEFLDGTMKELKEMYPERQFRSIGCTFSPTTDYMTLIQSKTSDLNIQIIFNNAGYILTGFLDSTPLPSLLSNLECNTTASISITHHFLQKLVKNKQKGCIVFTSSVAGFIPTPFAVMYSSTKAFVSQMACGLHVEVKNLGVDVCAVHPSPVDSRFYEKVEHKVELLEAAQKSAVKPSLLPDEIFKSIGVCALRDIGGLAWSTRMGTFFLPFNFFTEMFTVAAPFLGDYQKYDKIRGEKKTTKTS